MDCNVGLVEQKARVMAGLTLIGLGAYYNSKALAAVGLIPIATAILRWCPLNTAIGYNGCTNKLATPKIRKM